MLNLSSSNNKKARKKPVSVQFAAGKLAFQLMLAANKAVVIVFVSRIALKSVGIVLKNLGNNEGADPFRCNSTNGKNPPIQQNGRNS